MRLVGNEIAKHGGITTKNELAAVENKIPDVSSLLKKNRFKYQNY